MQPATNNQLQTTNNELLSFRGIEKAFFGVKVLKGVSFTVPAGGMVGLVGENGAGKSTLMNILGGDLQPDAGTITLEGSAYAPLNPQDATRRGIAFIHQELNLFPNLSIAENIFLTRFPRAGVTPFIQRGGMNRRAVDLLREVGLEIPPDRLVETLSAGERQLVEIAKALSIDARLILFDEPTTSLSERETDRLFALISRMRARGITMIYISHTLADVFRLCDDIVVLRDGEVVGSGATKTFTTEKLVSLMVGRTVSQLFPERRSLGKRGDEAEAGFATGVPLLEVNGVSQPGVLKDVSFTLRRTRAKRRAPVGRSGRSVLQAARASRIHRSRSSRHSFRSAVACKAPRARAGFAARRGATCAASRSFSSRIRMPWRANTGVSSWRRCHNSRRVFR